MDHQWIATITTPEQHKFKLGDAVILVYDGRGQRVRVSCVVDEHSVRIRPRRWYDLLVLLYLNMRPERHQ